MMSTHTQTFEHKVPIKPPSAVCPYCDQEVHVAWVSGKPRITLACPHSTALDLAAKPIHVVFTWLKGELDD